MKTEFIEKIIAFLIKPTENEQDFKAQLKVLDLFNLVLANTLYSVDYLLVTMINNFYRIKVSLGYENVGLKQDDISRQMEVEIKHLIYDKEFDISRSVFDAELPLDITNPSDMSEIINTFYSRFSDSLESIFSLEIDGVQAMMEVNALKHFMVDELYREKLLKASKLYNEAGVEASLEGAAVYETKISQLKNINTSCNSINVDNFVISSYEDYLHAEKATAQQIKELYKMGFEPLDEKFSICSNDIVVIIAEINAGKTRLIEDQAYKAITSGVNITLIPTETEAALILPKLILMHMFNLFRITNIPLSPESFVGKDPSEQKELFDDIMQKYEFAKRDLWDNKKHGHLHFLSNISYENCAKEFYDAKFTYKSEIIFLDHTRALSSTGALVIGRRLTNQKEQLQYLASCIRTCKTAYGIAFVITSHPSSDNSKNMSSSKIKLTTNLSAGATEISEIATKMFYLSQTFEGEALDTVQLHESKNRQDGKNRQTMIIKRWGSCNVHTYEESYQQGDAETDTIGELIDVED